MGGEARGPRQHSPLLNNPMQETMDCSMKMDEYSSLYGRILTRGMLIYMLIVGFHMTSLKFKLQNY